VRAAAGLFSGMVAAGQLPPPGFFPALVAAARVRGMLEDPAVLTASKWQDWLHPRGKDGRFIEKESFVNVFANPNALLSDRTAVRRRGRINELRPEGAYVTYQDLDGNPLPADPDAGFPDLIPVDQLSTKVSTAPQAIAHLQPGESAAKEVSDALVPAMSRDAWEKEIAELSASLAEQRPEQAAIVSTGQGEITPEDFQSHQEYIDWVNTIGIKGPGRSLSLDGSFKDSFGLWSEEMQQVFDALVDQAYNDLTDNQSKPRDRRAIMLGGLPGSGKSSTLEAMSKGDSPMFREDEWIIANPDYFKDVILANGLGPQLSGMTPAETATFIHEASSEMNHMLEQLLTVEGYNVIFDITMGGRVRDGEKSWTEKIVDRLEALDYTTDGLFVDVPPAVSRQRAQSRHMAGLNALRTGKSKRDNDPELVNGGRVVPDAVIASSEFGKDDPEAENYSSHNARNFDRLKEQFARWAFWDNSGSAPEFVTGSGPGPDDPDTMPGYYPQAAPAQGAQAA
jgi:hypothetical protein